MRRTVDTSSRNHGPGLTAVDRSNRNGLHQESGARSIFFKAPQKRYTPETKGATKGALGTLEIQSVFV